MAARAKHPSYIAWRRVVQADPCAYCGKPGGTADHIVPRNPKSGQKLNVWDNLTGACKSCNMLKGTLSPLGFLLSRTIHHEYLDARAVGSQRSLGLLGNDRLPHGWQRGLLAGQPHGWQRGLLAGQPPEAGTLGSLP